MFVPYGLFNTLTVLLSDPDANTGSGIVHAWGSVSNVTAGNDVTISLKNFSPPATFQNTNWNGTAEYFISVFDKTTE